MNIVCNIDDKYVQHCVVMLTSLFENNQWEKHSVYIISGQLSTISQKKISDWVVGKYKHDIYFYVVGEEILDGCKIYGESHISMATYYRIFLESILPSNLAKVLYLDCDLVVVGSLEEMWNTDISNYAVACVEDMWSGKLDNYTRLHYDSSYSYFNAGVLLINLDYWRKIGFEKKASLYIKEHIRELVFNDQDVLNALLHSHKLFLPFRYNLQDGFYRVKRKIRKEASDHLDLELQTPVIIHYTGSKKPWDFDSLHPYKVAYFKYLDMTEWQGERPKIPCSYLVHKVIMQVFYFLHLAPRKYNAI